MGAGEVVERALRHHTHGAARRVRGLCHRVEGAVAADGDHRRGRSDGPCRSLVRDAGQFVGTAEQQLTAPSPCPERGFDDLAFRVGVTAARRSVDHEPQR